MANILENKEQLNINNTTMKEQLLSMVRELPEYVEPVEYNEYSGDNPLTIGENGITIPANTLLEDALQILNGVEAGVSGIDYGMLTFSVETTGNVTVNHNLEKTPSWACLVASKYAAINSTGGILVITPGLLAKQSSNPSSASGYISMTSSNITFTAYSNAPLIGGPYYWFAIA